MIPNPIELYVDIMIPIAMEIIEWISLGFVPSYIDLELETRELARIVTGKLFSDVKGKK
jgi:hypothetical protein